MKLIRYSYPQPSAAFNQFFNMSGPSIGRFGSAFDQLFESKPGFAQPAVDLFEDEAAYYARFELPGIRKEDLDLELEDSILTVSQSKRESEEGGASKRGFRRAISVPDGVELSGLAASLEDGVLTVTMPKAATAKPRQITVE